MCVVFEEIGWYFVYYKQETETVFPVG